MLAQVDDDPKASLKDQKMKRVYSYQLGWW